MCHGPIGWPRRTGAIAAEFRDAQIDPTTDLRKHILSVGALGNKTKSEPLLVRAPCWSWARLVFVITDIRDSPSKESYIRLNTMSDASNLNELGPEDPADIADLVVDGFLFESYSKWRVWCREIMPLDNASALIGGQSGDSGAQWVRHCSNQESR
jgi:hypothetical protein